MVNFVDEIARVTDITKALKTKKNLFDSFKKLLMLKIKEQYLQRN